MNQEQAKAWLPLIQAVAEGKTLQTKVFRWVEDELHGVHWVFDWVETYGEVDFSTPPSRWRIKPEPKKAWYRVAIFKGAFDCFPLQIALGEQMENQFQVEKDFIRWLTDRIEYQLPERNDSLAFSANIPQSKIGVDK